jgi:hypothetical protein
VPWLLRLAALAFLATVLQRSLGATELVRSAELLALAGAVTVVACALVALFAVDAVPQRAGATLAWAALAALTVLLLAAATGGVASNAVALAAGVFLLVASFGFALTLVAAALRDRLAAATLLAALGALAVAAPIWLGPIAERFAPTGAFVDGVVAASPLSYLAVLADHDYLRATWFYEHTALGSLRYDYPAVLPQSVIYALPLVAAAALRLPPFTQTRFAKELFR